MDFNEEIKRRRTFAIISHPDAGKTTLTEKLLLFGGAIHVAGAVKSNKIKKTATSDFMEIERQRGISVATSVMGFEYNGVKINILDTPGHQDFAEDTFRTLTAVDSVIVVIDAAKGVEAQTEKLMKVCRMRNTPVIVFINKIDREGKDPFDLLDEIERQLQIHVHPLSWPVGMGQRLQGVYNIFDKKMYYFSGNDKTKAEEPQEFKDLNDPEFERKMAETLRFCATISNSSKAFIPISTRTFTAKQKLPPFSSEVHSITLAFKNFWNHLFVLHHRRNHHRLLSAK